MKNNFIYQLTKELCVMKQFILLFQVAERTSSRPGGTSHAYLLQSQRPLRPSRPSCACNFTIVLTIQN